MQHRENPLENNCYHRYCWAWLAHDVDYSYLLVAKVMQQKVFQFSQSCEDNMRN